MMTEATRDDAQEMGRAAAAAAMRYFRGRLGIEFKSDESPVTQADRGVEAEEIGRASCRERV